MKYQRIINIKLNDGKIAKRLVELVFSESIVNEDTKTIEDILIPNISLLKTESATTILSVPVMNITKIHVNKKRLPRFFTWKRSNVEALFDKFESELSMGILPRL